MSKIEQAIGKLCDHEDQIDTKSSTEKGLKVKGLFDLESHNNREAMRENRGTLLFPRAGVQPAENPSGSAPMNKRSQPPRSLPRKTFIKEPSPGSARIPLSPSRIPKDTNRCARGENNYARPACSPSAASL